MLPPKSFSPLTRVIETEPLLATWLRRYRLEAALTRTVRAHLPRLLASQVRVTDLRGGQLELTVPSGTLATAVRQRTPELLAALAAYHEFNGIRVRVQPLSTPLPTHSDFLSPRRAPPAVAPLRALAQDLPDGPLKKAIARLIRQR
jgi:hypothetical protein